MSNSEHFKLIELSSGVFAAISNGQGAAVGNAGIIDLGGQTLVFDTFLTPQAALDLKNMAVEHTGREPNLVINSHYHNDHIWGNQVFLPDALILSSDKTRRLITADGQAEYDWVRANAETQLNTVMQGLEAAESEEEQAALAMWLGYFRGLIQALPTLRIQLPSITFPERCTIHGDARHVELFTYEDGHTGSDTILFLPEEGVLFASDLLFVKSHPYLSNGNPVKLIEILGQIAAFPASRIVPGHGSVGTQDDVLQLIDYIKACIEIAERMIGDDVPDDAVIEKLPIPELYSDWQFPTFFSANMRFLVQSLST